MASLLRIASLGLLAFGMACVVALHALRTDLEPAGHRISEYAIGPYGSVMTVGFFAIGAALVALAWPVAASRGRWSRAVAAAFAVAGAGMVISGIYPTDPGRSGPAADNAHSRASLVATLALLGAALVWSLLQERPRWRLDISSALAVAATLLAAISPLLHHSMITGISQRLLWLTLLTWVAVAAWRLRPRTCLGQRCGGAVSQNPDRSLR